MVLEALALHVLPLVSSLARVNVTVVFQSVSWAQVSNRHAHLVVTMLSPALAEELPPPLVLQERPEFFWTFASEAD